MKGTLREFIKIGAALIVLFLILSHFKGAVSVLGTGGKVGGGLIRDFQGRGSY